MVATDMIMLVKLLCREFYLFYIMERDSGYGSHRVMEQQHPGFVIGEMDKW